MVITFLSRIFKNNTEIVNGDTVPPEVLIKSFSTIGIEGIMRNK